MGRKKKVDPVYPTCIRCNKVRDHYGLGGPRHQFTRKQLSEMAFTMSPEEIKQKIKKAPSGDGWIWHNGLYVCGDCLRIPRHRQAIPENAPKDYRHVEQGCAFCNVPPNTACPEVIKELVEMGADQNRKLISGKDVRCPLCGAGRGEDCVGNAAKLINKTKPGKRCPSVYRKTTELVGLNTDFRIMEIEGDQLKKRIATRVDELNKIDQLKGTRR